MWIFIQGMIIILLAFSHSFILAETNIKSNCLGTSDSTKTLY